MKAYAFDRDGTLAWGDPPGPISCNHILRLRKLGHAIGGSGGQPLEERYQNWRDNGVEPDFAVHKALDMTTLRYDVVVHVGDADDDSGCARSAGIGYMDTKDFLVWFEKQQGTRNQN